MQAGGLFCNKRLDDPVARCHGDETPLRFSGLWRGRWLGFFENYFSPASAHSMRGEGQLCRIGTINDVFPAEVEHGMHIRRRTHPLTQTNALHGIIKTTDSQPTLAGEIQDYDKAVTCRSRNRDPDDLLHPYGKAHGDGSALYCRCDICWFRQLFGLPSGCNPWLRWCHPLVAETA